MEKRDWVWVAVHVAGIYLLVRAVLLIPAIVNSIFLVTPTTASLGTVLPFVIYGCIGICVVRSGGDLLRLLVPAEAPKE